jgi:deazaflavin-dependent oxidoreductase (nitroreductase family)
MTVELTPNGTYGVHMPRIPRPLAGAFWKLFSFGARLRGARLLDLTTVGAKTGREHTIPLAWFPDGEEAWLIVASYGGARQHPAWYVNLARNPGKVWIRIGNRKWHVRPESLKGAERDETFRRIAAVAPGYVGYQKKTDRVIPVIRLKPAVDEPPK